MDNRPIFIVGASRSGNTLFRMILSSHTMICIPPESQFIHYLDPVFHARSNDKKDNLRMKLLNDEKFADWNIDEKTLSDYIEKSIDKNYAEFIAGIYQLYLNKVNRQNTQWGDKNPMYIFIIKRLLHLFSGAQIILLIREPLSIYGSLKRINFFCRETEIAINDYYRRIKCVADAIIEYQNNPNVILISYSAFVKDPENNTRTLIKRLGYDFEPAMLHFNENESFVNEMLQSKVKFHENLLKPISGSFIKPDNYGLEEAEINVIEQKLKDELQVIRAFIDNNPAL